MERAIHWFRRDLRLTDNTALAAAVAQARQVIPVYIVSGWRLRHGWTGASRQAFLCGCLQSLARNLGTIGGRLIVRQGDAVSELERLAVEMRAEAIFFNRDPDPFGRKTEAALERMAQRIGVALHAFKDVCLHERDEVLTADGRPFKVFTPYARAWGRLPKPSPSGALRAITVPPEPFSLPLPGLQTWGIREKAGDLPASGEHAARDRMKGFVEKLLPYYGAKRDIPAAGATSRLSQDLRFGLLSIRELFARCQDACRRMAAENRVHAEKYISELIWREFYMNILWHHPDVLKQEFNPRFRGMPWEKDASRLERWREGRTGFPIVDAGMRELALTGFMHNRVRMIAAMFLTKDLHLDWRLGERHFMRLLVDGEIASNNGGWQWSAGTGADAAPYFRIQNPWTQTARYDPDGLYIKKWIPELQGVPASALACAPESGGSIAKGYPPPMVDHAVEREAALAMFARYGGGT